MKRDGLGSNGLGASGKRRSGAKGPGCDDMDAPRFTPGPWEKYDEYGIIGIRTAKDGTRIAVMDNEDESSEEYDRIDADADLLASAPVMYEALCAVVGHGFCAMPSPAGQDAVAKSAIAKVRAALALIHGRKP